MSQCNLGLFADGDGYALSIVEFKKQFIENDYCYVYTILDESYNSENVSKRAVVNAFNHLYQEYHPSSIFINNLPTLIDWIKCSRSLKIQDLNVTNGLFVINSLLQDEVLIFDDKLKLSFINELRKLGENKEITNHRVFALMLALTDEPHDFSWLSA